MITHVILSITYGIVALGFLVMSVILIFLIMEFVDDWKKDRHKKIQ